MGFITTDAGVFTARRIPGHHLQCDLDSCPTNPQFTYAYVSRVSADLLLVSTTKLWVTHIQIIVVSPMSSAVPDKE